MFYILYKITNKINGKIYIGTHKTNNLDDGYFGSGKHLKRSINKYGIENFTKDIMQVFRSAEEMFDMEEILVDEGFVKRKDTYNIREGGFGGFDHIIKDERYKDWTSLGGKEGAKNFIHGNDLKSRLIEKGTWDEYRKNLSKSLKDGHKNGSIPLHWVGKKHTEESKQKIGEANSKLQSGQGNSQYGKCWIYCPYTHESKPIPGFELKEWENRGWVKGRKIKRVVM